MLQPALDELPAPLHVSVVDLGGAVRAHQASTTELYAASTIKIFVAAAALAALDSGRFRAGEHLQVHTTFSSACEGRTFRLSPQDEDAALAAADSQLVAVHELIERAVTVSSNTATNLLLEQLGLPAVAAAAAALGARSTRIERLLGDRDAATAGYTNTTTSSDLAYALAAIARADAGTIGGTTGSALRLRSLLLAQSHREYFAAPLPPAALIAHKTGWIEHIAWDAAAVWPPDAPPYALAACAPDRSPSAAAALLQEVSRRVYAHRQADSHLDAASP